MSWQVLCGLLCASITNLSVAFLWACMRDELGSCSCWGTSINFKISTDHVQCSRGLLYRSFHSCYVLFCTFNPIPSKQPSACWARFGPQLPHTYTKAGTITIHQLLASLLACCRCRRLWKSMASQWWSSHSKVDARVCHAANDTNYSWAIQFWNMLPWCAMIQWSCPGDLGNVAHTDVVAREALAAWTWWRHDRSSLQACSYAYNANFPFRRPRDQDGGWREWKTELTVQFQPKSWDRQHVGEKQKLPCSTSSPGGVGYRLPGTSWALICSAMCTPAGVADAITTNTSTSRSMKKTWKSSRQ